MQRSKRMRTLSNMTSEESPLLNLDQVSLTLIGTKKKRTALLQPIRLYDVKLKVRFSLPEYQAFLAVNIKVLFSLCSRQFNLT